MIPPLFVLEPSWQEALKDELTKPYLTDLALFVEQEYARFPEGVYPPKSLIFNAFFLTPFQKTRVLIIGQDPYHGFGQAHGLSFSVPKGVLLPPSLKNIFKEMQEDVGITIPPHGCLNAWAEQGVMLLNATLTVKESSPLSHHKKGWELFTDAVVKALIKRKEPVVFVLWGRSAQEKCRFLKEESGTLHTVLASAHPSPLSAHSGFFGSRPFSKINAFLEKNGSEPINWQLF